MITMLSNIGTHHVDKNGENQDFVFYGHNKKYDVISLADGVSSCGEAKCGAEIASKAITNLLLKKGEHFLEFENEQIAEFALSHILSELSHRAVDDSKDVEEYSSTISSVLFDKRHGKILYFNLGDSIIAATGNGQCRVLAMPSDSSSGCCVTTTKNAASMVSVKVIDVGFVESVVICSDGAWKQMLNKNKLKPEVAGFLANNEYENLKEFLVKQDSFDDYSFISLDIRQKNRRKSA